MPIAELDPLVKFLQYMESDEKNGNIKKELNRLQKSFDTKIEVSELRKAFSIMKERPALLIKYGLSSSQGASNLRDLLGSIKFEQDGSNFGTVQGNKVVMRNSNACPDISEALQVSTSHKDSVLEVMDKSPEEKVALLEARQNQCIKARDSNAIPLVVGALGAGVAIVFAVSIGGAAGSILGLVGALSGGVSLMSASSARSSNGEAESCGEIASSIRKSIYSPAIQLDEPSLSASVSREGQKLKDGDVSRGVSGSFIEKVKEHSATPGVIEVG